MKTKRVLWLISAILFGLTLVWIGGLCLAGRPGPAHAAGSTHTVCPPESPTTCDYTTIQEAVDAAVDGDVIKVAEGTYMGIESHFGHVQVVYLEKSVTIQGGYTTAFTEPPDPEAHPTTVDADGKGRVFYIAGDTTPTIAGLRITGGDATVIGSEESGGGVFIQFAAATFMDNQIFGNHAKVGGGFNLDQSATTLSNNTIISNSAVHGGGGVWMWQCDKASLNNNTISFNTAITQAGGLWSGGTKENVQIINNTFSQNKSEGYAGGLELQDEGISLIGNTIISNTATWGGGGGLFLLNGEFNMKGNTISGNKAGGSGGINLWYARATLIGNTIARNSAGGIGIGESEAVLIGNTISGNTGEYGAGLNIGNNSTATISDNTIISNTASSEGGGIMVSGDGDVTIKNNHIISNTAGGGGGISISDGNGVQTIEGNLFSGNASKEEGGGLFLGGGNPTLINNIIVDNHTDNHGSAILINGGASASYWAHNTIARNRGGDGTGIFAYETTITLTNNIIVSHTIGIHIHTDATATFESTFWGSGVWENDSELGGDGVRSFSNDQWGNPDFVNYQAGDYHLGPDSAAIDKGVDMGVKTDFDSQPRPYETPDIGADEYWPPGVLKAIYLPLVNR